MVPGAQGPRETYGMRTCSSFSGTRFAAAAPDVYYVTDHYVDYNAVLVRLSRVKRDVLRDLLGRAYKFVTSKTHRSPSRKRGDSGL